MENPPIDLLRAACSDPGRFTDRFFFSPHFKGGRRVPEDLEHWQARAVQAAIRGLASGEAPGALRIKQPLRFRGIAGSIGGEDLFVCAEVVLSPGESVTWQYPAEGIKIETDIPVKLTP